jgi:hypothetical protein
MKSTKFLIIIAAILATFAINSFSFAKQGSGSYDGRPSKFSNIQGPVKPNPGS